MLADVSGYVLQLPEHPESHPAAQPDSDAAVVAAAGPARVPPAQVPQ